jgi:hypothetical protein
MKATDPFGKRRRLGIDPGRTLARTQEARPGPPVCAGSCYAMTR